MTTHSAQLNEAAKRDALRRALESDTFARADQLKHLLTYVCEMEILGRLPRSVNFELPRKLLGREKTFRRWTMRPCETGYTRSEGNWKGSTLRKIQRRQSKSS